MTLEKQIGMTMTGEVFQPVRLYYQVFNPHQIKKDLDLLRCIDFDTSKNRWIWLYDKEAKSIHFEQKFSSIPEEVRPVVIGYFVWKSSDVLVLDVRSYERALEAIKFFDKKISRSTAKVTHCSSVNKIFEARASTASNFDVFFENNEDLVEIKPEETIARMKQAFLSTNGHPDLEAIMSFLANDMERFFEVEKFPIHFYEEGINSLKTSFILRRIIAMERWCGNVTYSYRDAFERLTHAEGSLIQ